MQCDWREVMWCDVMWYVMWRDVICDVMWRDVAWSESIWVFFRSRSARGSTYREKLLTLFWLSQNHRMVGVGRDLCGHLVQPRSAVGEQPPAYPKQHSKDRWQRSQQAHAVALFTEAGFWGSEPLVNCNPACSALPCWTALWGSIHHTHCNVHQESKHSHSTFVQDIAAFCDPYPVCKMLLNPLRRRMSINYFCSTIVIPVLLIFSPVPGTIKKPSSFPLLNRHCLIFFSENNKCILETWRELYLRALICCEDERVREETFGCDETQMSHSGCVQQSHYVKSLFKLGPTTQVYLLAWKGCSGQGKEKMTCLMEMNCAA